MATVTLNLDWTPLAVCKLGAGAAIPDEAWDGEFCGVVRDEAGMSFVCESAQVPDSFTHAERGWRAVRIEEISQMSAAEAQATIARALRAAGVRSLELEGGVLLVKENRLRDAVVALERAGLVVEV